VKCTDVDDNIGTSATRTFTIDTSSPTYSDNSTSGGTKVGTSITHSLKWQDNIALSGYIFSFDNGTGTLANDSWAAFSVGGVEDWSNVSKVISDTESETICWCVYANDTVDNWNSISCETPFSYITTQPHINFSIWNGASWINYDAGEYPRFRCTPAQTDCEPTNQNVGSSQSIFRICNNGTGAGTSVYMNINETFEGIGLKCDDDYTTADAINLTTSNQTIHGALILDACTDISCWADYDNPTSGGYFTISGYVV